MSSTESLRDYGLGNTGTPIEAPTWKQNPELPPCPNCGAEVVEVSVLMEQPLLRGGVGLGLYIGCPACPWASPCVATALGKGEDA